MGILSDFKEAAVSALPFSVAWMQARCLSYNHGGRERVLIKQQTIEEHPSNDEDIALHCNLVQMQALWFNRYRCGL